jgi:hypothetical protein
MYVRKLHRQQARLHSLPYYEVKPFSRSPAGLQPGTLLHMQWAHGAHTPVMLSLADTD